MKTILLASSGKFVLKHASAFLPKPLENLKIAHIITASKGKVDTSYLEKRRDKIKELGWDVEEVDIDGKTEAELFEVLHNKEVVFVEGGNTFYLMKSIRESGFDNVIRKLIDQGVIYIGASAGSYVACPTIEVAAWKHQDKYDHYDVEDLQGMGLVSFLVTAHYTLKDKEAVSKGVKNATYPVKILSNDQAVLIKGDKAELVGNTEEICL